mgnify:CR=1 FL=1
MSQLDLSSRPGEPTHTARLMAVIDAIETDMALPVDAVAQSLGVSAKSLLTAVGFARVKCGSTWYTTQAEADRVRRILRPAERGTLFDIENAATDSIDAVLSRCTANAQRGGSGVA